MMDTRSEWSTSLEPDGILGPYSPRTCFIFICLFVLTSSPFSRRNTEITRSDRSKIKPRFLIKNYWSHFSYYHAQWDIFELHTRDPSELEAKNTSSQANQTIPIQHLQLEQINDLIMMQFNWIFLFNQLVGFSLE